MAALPEKRLNWWPVLAGSAFVATVVIAGSALLSRRRTGAPARSEAETLIARPRFELYRYWREFENLPHFMPAIEQIADLGGRSHWVVEGAGCEVEIIDDIEPEVLRWRSVAGSPVASEGTVEFIDNGGGSTVVRLSLEGASIGDASSILRSFKLLMES